MAITLLTEEQFDNFAINSPYNSFYQTSNYGNLMVKYGHNVYYLGLIKNNSIVAATLIIVKTNSNDKRKMGYAPRGFLIDWKDFELVKEFTNEISSYLSKRGFTSLKIDPYVVYKKHDCDNNSSEDINNTFVEKLQSLGYIHMGYNNGTESIQPRWGSYATCNNNVIELYNSISSNGRKKINDAVSYGNKIYKGSINDIQKLYGLLPSNKGSLDDYLDFYQFFNKNNEVEIFFVKLEPYMNISKSKKLYEDEEANNLKLNSLIQDLYVQNKEQLINEKIKSDNKVALYKKRMLQASELFQKYPNGLIIAGTMILKFNNTIYFITSGTNVEFKKENPEYMLKWQLMDTYSKQGFNKFIFLNVDNEFMNKNEYTVNKELATDIVEYVGEFDLVINKKSYYTGNRLSPILNWLNTPIK